MRDAFTVFSEVSVSLNENTYKTVSTGRCFWKPSFNQSQPVQANQLNSIGWKFKTFSQGNFLHILPLSETFVSPRQNFSSNLKSCNEIIQTPTPLQFVWFPPHTVPGRTPSGTMATPITSYPQHSHRLDGVHPCTEYGPRLGQWWRVKLVFKPWRRVPFL